MPLKYSLALLSTMLAPVASAQLAVPTWRDSVESCSLQSVSAFGPQEVVLSFLTFAPTNVFSATLRLTFAPSLTSGTPVFFCLNQAGSLTGTVQCAVSGTSAHCTYAAGVDVRECRLRVAFSASDAGAFAPALSFSGSLTGMAVAGGTSLPFKAVDPWELVYGDSFDFRPSHPDCHTTPKIQSRW